MPDPHVITLRKPVGPKGKEITELRLREPTAGEVMRASRESGRGMARSLLTQVTGVPADVIEALPGRVSSQAAECLMTFIAPALADPIDTPGDLLDELTIDLPDTIQVGTTWITKLELREPTLGELIRAEKYSGLHRTVALVALVSGLPRSVVELVPISVFAKAGTFVLGFTDAAPISGGELSDT